MKRTPCRLVRWEEIEAWCDDITSRLRQHRTPDVVIGLTRGGWVPARIICDRLGIKDLFAVKTEHWGITATQDGEARLAQKLPVTVEGKSVLIVDDITDTGKSLALAFNHLMEFKPAQVKSATLLHITHSSFVPDYYSVEVPKEEWTWFIFPWNRREDLRALVGQAAAESDDPKQMRDLLKKNCDLELSVDDIDLALEEISAAKKRR
ncbi:MAG TPA: phosphoribosyltransferase [Thermoplasmata archaeon]|nr:phosphoribosyltransferase [Thermoplasmata archaeon]